MEFNREDPKVQEAIDYLRLRSSLINPFDESLEDIYTEFIFLKEYLNERAALFRNHMRTRELGG